MRGIFQKNYYFLKWPSNRLGRLAPILTVNGKKTEIETAVALQDEMFIKIFRSYHRTRLSRCSRCIITTYSWEENQWAYVMLMDRWRRCRQIHFRRNQEIAVRMPLMSLRNVGNQAPFRSLHTFATFQKTGISKKEIFLKLCPYEIYLVSFMLFA